MQNRRALLDQLRAQLEFIEAGGYRKPDHAKWRPQFMFEDSPICLNRDSATPRKPCSECALGQFLPTEANGLHVPCRYIPLNEAGETVDSLYRSGTKEELEAAVQAWLKTTIERLEREEQAGLREQDHPAVLVKAKFVSPDRPV